MKTVGSDFNFFGNQNLVFFKRQSKKRFTQDSAFLLLSDLLVHIGALMFKAREK